MVEYNPWYKPGEQLMQCLECGAAVCDTELHSQWHDQMTTPGVWIIPSELNADSDRLRDQLLQAMKDGPSCY